MGTRGEQSGRHTVDDPCQPSTADHSGKQTRTKESKKQHIYLGLLMESSPSFIPLGHHQLHDAEPEPAEALWSLALALCLLQPAVCVREVEVAPPGVPGAGQAYRPGAGKSRSRGCIL